MTKEEKDNIIRQLVFQTKGELDYIERYAQKQREKLEELDIILSGQEQPVIEEDWVEKRKQECGCRKLLSNGNYQCERYEGVFGPCDGRCSWIVDYPKLKELEDREQPDADLEKEIANMEFMGVNDARDIWMVARHFFELGQRKAAEMYDEVEYNRQLAEEEMSDKTLDEAAEEYAYNNWEDNDYHTGASEGLPFDAIGHTANCFKAGAKWQEEKDQEIIKLAEDHAFLAGADWQKEQIMKGAVDGVVIYHDHPEYKYILVPYEEFNNGDKVHLIVLKTEEESK